MATSLDTLNAAAKASGSSAHTIRRLPPTKTSSTPWRRPRTHIKESDRTARASLDQSRTGVAERISERLIRLRGQPRRKARRSSVKVKVTVSLNRSNQTTKSADQAIKSPAVIPQRPESTTTGSMAGSSIDASQSNQVPREGYCDRWYTTASDITARSTIIPHDKRSPMELTPGSRRPGGEIACRCS